MKDTQAGVLAWFARLFGGRPKRAFDGSADYWESRYRSGGNSGVGSYDRFAEFKAEFLNDFIVRHEIETVIEFGCGDGNQLALLDVPDYTGVDVSDTVLEQCRTRFAGDASKRFLSGDAPDCPSAELSLSLDVIYHLVEDGVFERYIDDLFAKATRFVILYSSNDPDVESKSGPHVRHRRFTDRIDTAQPGWVLLEHVPNRYPYTGDYRTGSFADFYIYVPVESVGKP